MYHSFHFFRSFNIHETLMRISVFIIDLNIQIKYIEQIYKIHFNLKMSIFFIKS